MTLAQREVKTGVHAGASQYVVEQIESHATLVVNAVGAVAYHHVCLVSALVYDFLLRLVGWQWSDNAGISNHGRRGGKALGGAF